MSKSPTARKAEELLAGGAKKETSCPFCGSEGCDDPAHNPNAPPAAVFTGGDGQYTLELPGVVTLELAEVRRESHQLKGELLVRTNIPGIKTVEGVMSMSDLNLSAARTRQAHAAYLASKAKTEEIDFEGLLEELYQKVALAERRGEDAVYLPDLERPAPEETLRVGGFEIPKRHPSILFGDGGTTKSFLALYWAGKLTTEGLRIGFFDWELDGPSHRERLELLFGRAMPRILYQRLHTPLHREAAKLRGLIRAHQLDFVILDSIAFACDGKPEDAEVAQRYFQALRSFGIGSLNLAHVSKAMEGADQKPFGSVFWHNGARATWNVKRAESSPYDSAVEVALHHRKSNLGPRRPSLGYRVAFEHDRTSIIPIEATDIPDMAKDVPLTQRVRAVLREGPKTRQQVCEAIGDKSKDESIRTILNRDAKAGRKVLKFERDGKDLYALAAHQKDPE